MREDIIEFYSNHYDENSRLNRHKAPIELVRTQDIVLRNIPKPPAKVLDVGGGSGVYSSWLAKLGYDVHLIDIVPLHITQATEIINSQPKTPFTAAIGDATSLEEKSNSYEVVLLLGPLYHLIDRRERIKALIESHRVLKEGGSVFAAAISRYASLFDGMRYKWLNEKEFKGIVERDLIDGKHLSNNPKYFTTAYFHHADELIQEVEEAGFNVKETLAVEGICWLLKDLPERWANDDDREQLLYVLQKTEKEPRMIEVSDHFICIGEK